MRFWSDLPRWQKVAAVLTSLVGVYAAFGYIGIPRILRAQVPPLVVESIDRDIELGKISFDPFLFRLEVGHVRLLDQRGGDLAGFEHFTLDFDPGQSLWKQQYHFKEARLVGPTVDIEILASGDLDVADLGASDEPEMPETEQTSPDTAVQDLEADGDLEDASLSLPAIEFEVLSIERGTVKYTDHRRTPAFKRHMGPIQIEITNFATRPGAESPYALEATTSGATITWAGQITLDPLRSSGDLRIENIPLPWAWEFVADRAHFVVRDGSLDIGARYALDTENGVTSYRIEDGGLALSGLVVTPQGSDAPFITLPEFAVEDVDVDVDRQAVTIGKVHSRGARLAGHLDPAGEFSWISWLALDPIPGESAAPAEEPDETNPTEPTPPLTLSLAALSLDDWGFEFEDQSTSPAATLSLAPIALDVHDISLDLTKPLPVDLKVGVGETGSIDIDGTVTPDPLRLDLAVDVTEIDLTTFSPYLSDLGRFTLRRATAGAAGQLLVESNGEATPIIRYAGSVSVDQLAVADRRQRRDFLRFDRLALTGIDVASEPLDVAVGEIELSRPYVFAKISTDGSVNFSEVFAGGDDAADEPVEATPTNEQAAVSNPPIRVGKIRLVDGSFHFLDESLEPNYQAALETFNGSIEGLSSDPQARAKVDLSGKLNKHAPIRISGEINPLAAEGYTDLDISLTNLELSSFTPYAGKYAGYEIDKGKFMMELSYNLDARQVKGDNKLFLDQFEFGAKVDSEDATSLPVPFAVAILKDKSGEIHIDLPISGDLDDPEFSYGALVARTLVNLIAKAVTSPFGMLGNLVGLNPDELNYVAFDPGSAALSSDEGEKLAAIATALAERPSLRLEIRGSAGADDIPGLKVASVEDELKARRWDALSARKRKTMTGPDDIVLEADVRNDLLEDLYDDRFDESYRVLRNRLRAERKAAGASAPEDERSVVAAAMHRALVDVRDVESADLRALAKSRAAIVKDELVVTNEVAGERIFVVEVAIDVQISEAAMRSPLTLTGS